MSNHPTCEYVPGYLALTNIKTGLRDYYEVEKKIKDYLNGTSIQYIHDDNLCAFTCTQIYDDQDERIDNITIFWDNETEQHIVEVRKLKGDTMFHCALSGRFYKIYPNLELIFARQTSNVPSYNPNSLYSHIAPLS
jgi:hypothetical protein